MANFAVIDGNDVINTIVAESKAIAEEITGLTCVEFTDEGAEVGGTYANGTFTKRKPYPSWVLVDNNWTPPVAAPDFDENNPMIFTWNEEEVSWDSTPIVIPE
jgi:hypothetical protein